MRRRQRWGSQFSPALGNIFIFEDSFLSQELIYDLILFHFLSDFISLVGTSRESYLKMSRHGGAIRILSKEILGFKNLLSLASHKSWLLTDDTWLAAVFHSWSLTPRKPWETVLMKFMHGFPVTVFSVLPVLPVFERHIRKGIMKELKVAQIHYLLDLIFTNIIIFIITYHLSSSLFIYLFFGYTFLVDAGLIYFLFFWYSLQPSGFLYHRLLLPVAAIFLSVFFHIFQGCHDQNSLPPQELIH